MTTNGALTCIGQGCTHKPVAGMSYCSEDHYEQLVDERKARSHYRSAIPVQTTQDFSATLKPPSNIGLIKPPKPELKTEPAPEWDERWTRVLSAEQNRLLIEDIELPVSVLMNKYRLSETAVRNTKKRCGYVTQPEAKPGGRTGKEIDPDQIRKLHAGGMGIKPIARQLGVAVPRVRAALGIVKPAAPSLADDLPNVKLKTTAPKPSITESYDAVIQHFESQIAELQHLVELLNGSRNRVQG